MADDVEAVTVEGEAAPVVDSEEVSPTLESVGSGSGESPAFVEKVTEHCKALEVDVNFEVGESRTLVKLSKGEKKAEILTDNHTEAGALLNVVNRYLASELGLWQ